MMHAVLRSRLAAPAASVAAPYSQGQKRVALLVHALTSARVFSWAALARALARNPAFSEAGATSLAAKGEEL